MVALEPVISVRELPPARSRLRQHLPSIRELVSEVPFAQEAALLSYLSQGVVCGVYNDRGLLFDVLQPGRRIDEPRPGEPGSWMDRIRAAVRSWTGRTDDPGPEPVPLQPGLILTDGTWVWPGVLPYYVAVYHLRLPARFLRFAEEHHWRIDPSSIDPQGLSWDAYDAVPEVALAERPRPD
jgi:hypothetical protein